MRSSARPSGHRTDVHTKKYFDPADYEVVAYVYVQRGQVGTPKWVDELPAELRADVVDELMHLTPNRQRESLKQYWPTFFVPGTDTGAVDRCAHCGLLISHIAVARHTPTGDYIPLGLDCAERAHMGSKAELIAKSNGRTREELQLNSLYTSLERQAGDALDQFRSRKPKLTGSANRRARETCRAMRFWIRDDATDIAEYLDRSTDYQMRRYRSLLGYTGYLYSYTADYIAKRMAAQPVPPKPAQPTTSITVRGYAKVTRYGKLFILTSTGDRVLVPGGKAVHGTQVTFTGTLTRPDTKDPNFGILKNAKEVV